MASASPTQPAAPQPPPPQTQQQQPVVAHPQPLQRQHQLNTGIYKYLIIFNITLGSYSINDLLGFEQKQKEWAAKLDGAYLSDDWVVRGHLGTIPPLYPH